MKKQLLQFFLFIGILLPVASGYAVETSDLDLADDITKETLVGPGSVQVITGKDLLMSFGALIRFVPTSETNWDFGMSDNVDGFLGGKLGNNFFKDHPNESGWVNNSYIRSENKIFFNSMPKDRRWSFYAALEYDSVLENASVDSRGGKTNKDSNFGLERLHVTMAMPKNTRFHAGWDVWHLDAFEGAGLVYGDDNPGFWYTGQSDNFDFNIGYIKLMENDFQAGLGELNDEKDDDRDLYAGYLTYKPNEINTFRGFYAFDRIRSIRANDLLGRLTGGAAGISGGIPKTDSHHIGGYYVGKFGGIQLFAEGVYQFGKAEDTGLAQDDYDINAYALAADLSYEFKGILTEFAFKPHIGVMYTSGDDNPDDDELGGYNGVTNAQRFSNHWGGENTIIGDTNLVLGSILYGYIPELYGNGTPVFTGGLQNVAGLGSGRGDNPGLTMFSTGLTMAPKRFLIYKTNVNFFYWNEDVSVANMVNPALGYTTVDSGFAGTEWDNELTLALSPNTFIKGQAAFYFPGEVIEDVTRAISGEPSDDVAVRLAAELIWKF